MLLKTRFLWIYIGPRLEVDALYAWKFLFLPLPLPTPSGEEKRALFRLNWSTPRSIWIPREWIEDFDGIDAIDSRAWTGRACV